MKPEDLAGTPPARLPFPVTRSLASAVECRAEGEGMPTMVGHFATFGDWYEVDSWIEGHFLESIGRRAFDKTIAESRSQMKVLYDHGQDPQIGNKILGPIEDLRTDRTGPKFAVPLFDTSYNRDLRPGLEAGVYGSSFRFTVEKDAWDQSPEASDHNPAALPERTITEARVFEFGPVTFPANPNATAGVRSTTDAFYQRSRDPDAFEALLRSAQVARTPVTGAAAEPAEPPSDTPTPEPSRSDTPPAIVEPPIVAVIPDPKESRAVEYISRDEKVARITELKDIQARMASEFPGVFPEDVQPRWDAYVAEQDDLERDVAAWDARQARIAANAANVRMVEAPAAPVPFNVIRSRTEAEISDIGEIRSRARSDDEFRQGLRDNAMRVVERARFPHPRADQAGAQAHVAGMLDNIDSPDGELAQRVISTNHPLYRRAFNKYLAGKTFSPEEQRYAAVTTGGTTTGGYATPWVLDPTIIAIGAHTSTNPYRAACRVVNLVGTNKWEALTATEVLTAYAGEAVAPAEGGPTFAQPTYECLKASGFVTLSFEILEDRPDIASELAVLFQESKDTLEENKFAVGAGTTVPWGMVLLNEYTTLKTHGAGATDIVDIFAMEMAVPIRHRAKGAWFGSLAGIRQVQALETVRGELFNQGYGLVGNPNSNATGNTGLQLLGHPVWEAPSMVATFTTADTNILWFGDPASYIIVDRVGLNIERVDNIFDHAAGSRPLLQRGLLAHWRNTARRVNVDAGRTLVVE
jgi:HK97 family phage major capsid protein/HK97 family phage prohead protease